MSLQVGQELGSYEITSLLGKGGMGEVYRARDAKLKRDVAIKILPDEFSRDPERVSRFQREAEALAALSHQNIAGIYDLQQSDTTRFLVLELVEGDTLADILKKRGALPVDEALQIGKQICEALEAAHEKGIVHRDLKPANVKIMADGKVKVLDFGLAKAVGATPSNTALSNSPTLSVAGTNAGVILGTAAYMSPEQAKGFNADRRSDIFSFGCVLHEMLTGHQTFDGDTVSEVLASVLKSEPDWSPLPKNLNPKIRELLRRALQKDRNRRLRDIGDAKIEIEEALANPTIPAEANLPVNTRDKQREWAAWAVAGVAIVTLAVLSFLYFNRPKPLETYVQVVTPPTTDAVSMSVSPDGRKLVFVGSSQGGSQLFLRSLDSGTVQPLQGTEGAAYPFWSPDSRSVGFFAGAKLKRIDVPGGAVQVLANVTPGRGGTWNEDGVILFSSSLNSSISRVSAVGGPVVEVTHLDLPRASGHVFPCFLPDGRHFLFFLLGSADTRGVYWGDLESKGTMRLLDSDTAAVYSPTGHLLFVRQGTLFGQRFDPGKPQLLGDPFPIAEQATFDGAAFLGALSAGANALAYRTGGSAGNRQLLWLDQSGKTVGTVTAPDGSSSTNPELSPDGSRVTLDRTVGGDRDVWVLEPPRQITTRFTFDSATDFAPVWSPDGARIVFSSNRKGVNDLYSKPSSGAGSEELLLESTQQKLTLDWSRDGRYIIYRTTDPKNSMDLWVLPLSGDRKPFPFIATSFTERDAQFSPDVHLVAYQSDESGRNEIYVQSFPGPGGKWQVSNAGGTQPRWRRDGKVLFYIAADGKLMSASVETTPDGKTFKAAPPAALFATNILGITVPNKQQYAVSPDGQRFLMVVPTESASVSPITLVLNWNPGSKK